MTVVTLSEVLNARMATRERMLESRGDSGKLEESTNSYSLAAKRH